MVEKKKKAKKAPEDAYVRSHTAPLYKITQDLLYKIDDILVFLQKDRRHTIGQHMLNSISDMISHICLAYDFPNTREEQLKLYLIEYHKLSSMLKLLQDKGYLDYRGKNYYVGLIEPLGLAFKQAKAWLSTTIDNAGISDCTTE